jgi:glycosyltransferase involved in cell wall biosynthesis
MKALKVAIVHDWLYGGGAEKVVEQLHLLFPDAPIYTSYCTDEWRSKLDNKVVTGYLQHWPFSKLRRFLPILRQRWFRKLNLGDFDLIISSSGNGEAKFVRVAKPATHICYCHTPTHFYWRKYNEYLENPSIKPKWLARLGLRLLVKPLRQRDYAAAQKVDYFIANSTHIQNDIKTFYGRESVVIHPPVDTERFASATAKSRKGFITVGRQVPYKRTDIIIEACNQLNEPLTVIGSGPDHERLVRLAGSTISFREATNEELPAVLAASEAFIFAAEEDFGITPVEAMAAGTPVIAYKAGGALDYVVPGETGEFFSSQNAETLADALKKFNNSRYRPEDLKKQAAQFSAQEFQEKLLVFLKTITKTDQ